MSFQIRCGRRKAVSGVSVVLLFAAAARAQSPSVIFDNMATTGGLDASGASPASQIDPLFPFDAGAADDFVLPASPLCLWSISGVRWTCKFWGTADPTPIGDFRIIFWSDADSAPQSGLAQTPDVALALASYIVPVGGTLQPNPNAPNAYDFEAALPQPLQLMPGRRYWIQVQAVQEYPPQWGMHITQGRQGLGPVQYFDLLSLPAWINVPDDGDLAFRLLGDPVSKNCDDGNACTTDTCVQGECISTTLICDDGDSCTADSCDPQLGCGYAAMNCADEDSCTTDFCQDGTCEHIGPPDFDGDADVDLMDFAHLAECGLRSAPEAESNCDCADLNGDHRIDLMDFAEIQRMQTPSQ